MKICKYCEAENDDVFSKCAACGSTEFSAKCGNCGNIFEGLFCPKCGVRAGQQEKKCPTCGRGYYSIACPDCGYVAGRYEFSDRPADIHVAATPAPLRKRKTWLWVLGWIFVFPVPLTILVAENKAMSKWVKILIIGAAWLFYFGIVGSGAGNA